MMVYQLEEMHNPVLIFCDVYVISGASISILFCAVGIIYDILVLRHYENFKL